MSRVRVLVTSINWLQNLLVSTSTSVSVEVNSQSFQTAPTMWWLECPPSNREDPGSNLGQVSSHFKHTTSGDFRNRLRKN